MSSVDELRESIAQITKQREDCAHRAWLLAERCAGLRADNPRDPRIKELSIQIDALDDAHRRLGDILGPLLDQLHDIESSHALRCRERCLNLCEY